MSGLYSFLLPFPFYLTYLSSRLAFKALDSEEHTLITVIVLLVFALSTSGVNDCMKKPMNLPERTIHSFLNPSAVSSKDLREIGACGTETAQLSSAQPTRIQTTPRF